jgi:hypothetical protein
MLFCCAFSPIFKGPSSEPAFAPQGAPTCQCKGRPPFDCSCMCDKTVRGCGGRTCQSLVADPHGPSAVLVRLTFPKTNPFLG